MTGKTSKAKAEAVTGANPENGPDIIQPEKFDFRSHSISEEKQRELLRLFPEAQTEGEKVDFNRLKLALGESVDTGKERYGLTWPGKADCFKAIRPRAWALCSLFLKRVSTGIRLRTSS